MKKCLKTILGISFAVSALAFSAAVGAASSFGSVKTEVAKADPVTYSGNVIIRKDDIDMKYTESKLVAYFFDSHSHTGWGDAVWNTENTYQEYSWALSFEPETIIVLRVDGANWSSESPWSNVWCRTGDIALTGKDVIWMQGQASESDKWGTFSLDAVVKGGESDDWTIATVDAPLTHMKTSQGGESYEIYGSVSLPANTYFKVVKGGAEWCGAYNAHSSIASNLSGGGENNIHNATAATYEFYFDYEAKTTYITDPDYAAADEWAQYFLNNVGCDPDGHNLPSGWSSCAAKYALLSGDAKDIVYGASADESGNFIEQSMARYDYAVAKHNSLEKFVVDSHDTPRASSFVSFVPTIRSRNSTALIIILTVSSIAAVSGGLFIFLLKKKHSK